MEILSFRESWFPKFHDFSSIRTFLPLEYLTIELTMKSLHICGPKYFQNNFWDHF